MLKFIEANWDLQPDLQPQPRQPAQPDRFAGNPYVPINGPAIGDLMNLFDFNRTPSEVSAERQSLVHLTSRYTLKPFEHARVTSPNSHDLD